MGEAIAVYTDKMKEEHLQTLVASPSIHLFADLFTIRHGMNNFITLVSFLRLPACLPPTFCSKHTQVEIEKRKEKKFPFAACLYVKIKDGADGTDSKEIETEITEWSH